MKQSDIHVLNWDRIIQGTNNEQNIETKNKNTNKGILFEDLIENLLKAMFPEETWRRTIKSHDGKRDFVYPDDEALPDQKWAECKNYSSNVSINVIAPTLIMGSIENIDSIFFFSYSPLNENAFESLLRYSRTSKKTVKIFDGNMLESLICKYHNVNDISVAFPKSDFEKAYEVLKNKKLRVIKHLSDVYGNRISPTHQFELGETFNINIMFQNLIYESVTYNLALESSPKKILLHKPAANKYSLAFAESAEYSICCQALTAGNTKVAINITVDGVKTPLILTQKIKIIDEPYLFWTGNQSLHVHDMCVEYLLNNENMPLVIVAGLGMGKSTLINIISHEKDIIEKYKILKIDLGLTRSCCVRDLFLSIVDLCQENFIPHDQIEDNNETFSLLLENYAESAEMIAEMILKFYDPIHPYLVIIDDIQEINRTYISLLAELNRKAQEEEKAIYYLFAFDDDKYSVEELFMHLNQGTNYQSVKYKAISLPFFEKKDILAFVKHKFGLKNIDHYFNNFDNKITPLKVHQFCFNMKNKRIIVPKSGSSTYQILDPFAFAKSINDILCNDIPLKTICSSLGQNDIPDYILKYLYIVGEMSSETAYKYQKAVNGLVSFGIIRENNSSFILCQKEMRKKIKDNFKFIEEDYSDIYSDETIDVASKALCVLNQLGRIRNGTETLQVFFNSNYEIQKRFQRFEICWLIFENIRQLTQYNLISDALCFVKKNYTLLNKETGHSSFYFFLKHVADVSLEGKWDTDIVSVENMAFFIKKFFDRSLSTYNYHHCKRFFDNYVKIFGKIKNISNKRRFYWLAHYANRASIALDRTSSPLLEESEEITKMYEQAVLYSKKSGLNSELELQLLVDEFNRHYIYRHNLSLEIVNSTTKSLSNIKKKLEMRNELLEYNLLLMEYMSIRFANIKTTGIVFEEFKCRVRVLRESCVSAFFRLKLYLLEIYILFEMCHFVDADNILDSAIEFSYKKEMRSYIYKLTYIKAYLHMFLEKMEVSSEVYHLMLLAYEQLLIARKDSINDLKREIYLIVQLIKQITANNAKDIEVYSKPYDKEIQLLISKVTKYIAGEQTDEDMLFSMHSYFVFYGINFPNI